MYRAHCLSLLACLGLLSLTVRAAPPVAEKPAPKGDVRAPLTSGAAKGGKDMASRIFIQVALGYVLKVEEAGRAPRFSSEPTERGRRVVCNEIGNRYSYELVGGDVRQGKQPYSVWYVDDKPINVQTYRFRASEPLDGDRPFRARRSSDEKGGVELVKGSVEVLKLPGGGRAEYWEAVPTPKAKAAASVKKYQIGMALHGRTELAFVCVVRTGDDEKKSARLVRTTLLSVKGLPDLPSNKAALTMEYLLENGLTLKQMLAMQQGVSGKKHGALLNADLATLQDKRLRDVVVLSPKDLVDQVRLRLLAGRRSPRAFRLYDGEWASDDELREVGLGADGRLSSLRAGAGISATVFDGATAHTITLDAYDRKSGEFVYWEPWKDGTFLAKGNNTAGIAAQPYPGRRKFFRLTEAQLARVLYSVQFEWDDLEQDRQLRALLRRPEKEVVAELKKLRTASPKGQQWGEARLLGAGASCLVGGDVPSAVSALQACRELHPDCIEATVGLADARRKQGKAAEASALDREALARLAKDKRFAPLTKARLEKTIRDRLAAPPAKAPADQR